MLKLKLIVAATLAATLAGCGNSNAIEGEFKSETSMMGVIVSSGKAVFSKDYIIANGNKISVNEWAKENDTVIPRNEKGFALAQFKIEDNGNRLVQEIPMGKVTYTRTK